eukprot:scaffold5571_cov142-Isochrysis_galbana.AAC.2
MSLHVSRIDTSLLAPSPVSPPFHSFDRPSADATVRFLHQHRGYPRLSCPLDAIYRRRARYYIVGA